MKILYQPHEYSQQRQKDKKVNIYPVHLAMEATYRTNQQHEVFWESAPVALRTIDKVITEPEGIPFLKLPAPDRVFTNAFDKKYQSYGNYKYHPATHMMSALDCWYGKCTFCDWAKKYPNYQVRDVADVVEELDIIECLGFHEVFDDSGTFPVGTWLDDFLSRILRSRNINLTLGCNMRIMPNLGLVDFNDMKKAGFRMVLFGVESFNQPTLDRLNKGIKSYDIEPCIRRAAEAGLEPHVAMMTGYPWETYLEERNTIGRVKGLLINGYAKTAQVSLYDVPNESGVERGTKRMIYDVAFSPKFWFNKLKDITEFEDFLYLIKGIKKGVSRD